MKLVNGTDYIGIINEPAFSCWIKIINLWVDCTNEKKISADIWKFYLKYGKYVRYMKTNKVFDFFFFFGK